MKRYDVVCIGMAIMDSIIRGFDPEPVSATGYRAESGSLNAGGDAVNESIACSKLGLNTAILCSLGADPAGDMIKDELSRFGVCTDRIIRSEDHPTPITTIFVREDGNRRSITNGAHRYNFHPEKYLDQIINARAIILGSLFRAPFNDPEVIGSVVREAARRDILVFADTKLPNFRRLSLDDIADCLPYIDYITPNEDEARFYSRENEPEKMADVFLSKGARNVVIKLGSKGCYFSNGDVSAYVPAYNIDAVDATGAGDNFIAGLTSEILRGKDAADALRFAAACGAICTTAVGSGTALKDASQVREFMQLRPSKIRQTIKQ